MVNIVEITRLWDIARYVYVRIVVGILCGGMIDDRSYPAHRMVPPTAHRVEKHACALAGTCQSTVAAGTTDAIRSTRMRGSWANPDHEPAALRDGRPSGVTTVFAARMHC